MKDKEYVLGTHPQELTRLGLQHMVWAEEGFRLWSNAGLKAGDHVLDLGCGPGFCSRDLAYLVGEHGKVTAVDLSPVFIDFLKRESDLHQLPIEPICSSFESLSLTQASLDAVYHRWALAWPSSIEGIVDEVSRALKPRGKWMAHEYMHWMDVHTQPFMPGIAAALKMIFKSFFDAGGNIDIGAELPQLLARKGFEILHFKQLPKVVRPGTSAWQWPKSFLSIYLKKMVEDQQFSPDDYQQVLEEFKALESLEGSYFYTPVMSELLAVKK